MNLCLALLYQLALANGGMCEAEIAERFRRNGVPHETVATDRPLILTSDKALYRMESLLSSPLHPDTELQLAKTRASIDQRVQALKQKGNYDRKTQAILHAQLSLASEKDNRSAALQLVRRYAEEKKPFSIELMHQIHKTLFANEVWPEDRVPPGVVRFSNVLLGGGHSYTSEGFPKQSMMFLNPNAVKKALRNTEIWYQQNQGRLHPIRLASGLYRRLLSIHPYEDGNGRTCRLVADWILMSHGYPPTSFVKSEPIIPVMPYSPNNTPNDPVESLFTNSVVRSLWQMEQRMQ